MGEVGVDSAGSDLRPSNAHPDLRPERDNDREREDGVGCVRSVVEGDSNADDRNRTAEEPRYQHV